jgi:ABC-2 type transport system permease protein
MTRAFGAELLKLRTTRTFVALVGSAVALSLLVVVLITTLSNNLTRNDVRDVFGSTDTSALFILLLGAIGMAGEWRHQTIASTVLSAPHRVRLLLAKMLSYAVAGVVLSIVVNLVAFAVGTLILSARGEPTLPVGDLADVLWRNLLLAAYFGGIGVCVGALLRNPAGAIVLLLVLQFVIDPALFGLAHDVWRFGPLGGAPAAIAAVGDSEALPIGAGLAVLLGWWALLFAAAAATFTKRDLV